jgi:ribonuclease G
MSRRVAIEASPEEVRMVVLEDGRAAEIAIERGRASVAGNVYLGRVDRVLPGMQSAFVDVGLERHAFLHVSDLGDGVGGAVEDADEPEEGEEVSEAASLRRRVVSARRIEDHLKGGQSIIVQVSREPIAAKGARVTMNVGLPGRHLVFMPGSRHLGVSKRLPDEAERDALRSALAAVAVDLPGGYIARTAAAGQPLECLRDDAAELQQLWASVRARAASGRAPALLHAELPLHLRLLRDVDALGLERVDVDGVDAHAEIVDFLTRRSPDLAPLVRLHSGDLGLFAALGLEQEIQRALRDRVWLKSGGYLVINQMEALVAIDVNTGKFTGTKGLEETALKTNLEAAAEVGRQLRLRDLGGIVVIDFIDLEEQRNRQEVIAALESALARDRARTTMLGMSQFGLVEVTRQRQRRSLQRVLTDTCACCQGTGRVRSVETVVAQILRDVRRAAASLRARAMTVRCHPAVGAALREREAALVSQGRPLSVRLEVIADPLRHADSFDLTS